jgi:hypothetical protein
VTIGDLLKISYTQGAFDGELAINYHEVQSRRDKKFLVADGYSQGLVTKTRSNYTKVQSISDGENVLWVY